MPIQDGKQGGAGRSGVQRIVTSHVYLDTQKNPPEFVDQVIPTDSKNLLFAKRGRMRAPHGSGVGSITLTGSWRTLTGPGTYSLRITRVSLFTGSRNMEWGIWHSRVGTYDIIGFPTPGQETRLGAPMDPIYSFGPGTVKWGWLGDAGGAFGSAYTLSKHLEGFVG